MQTPSKRAIDLIVSFEVTDEATYKAKYQHTEWPGGASGVTIGIGYDLGYATKVQIAKDWAGQLPDAMIAVLKTASGVTGDPAKALAKSMTTSVTVPWNIANAVFAAATLPDTNKAVIKALANTDQLSGNSFGALVSLVYNRGASFTKTGPRFIEMNNIKNHMSAKAFSKIPDELLHMQRLWPTVPGLQRRRREESALFSAGL